jgi:phosphatidylethanolamine N-methyltransferase
LSTGDYFGILKEARVTTFPFSVLDNPMYWGSTANYLGWAFM